MIGCGRTALLVRADQHTRLAVDDLRLLAEVAYAAGHLDVTIHAWERAHAEAVRAGDSVAAADAATRVALHLLMDTALMAPIRGWAKRAERLLEGHDNSPAHAWLALILQLRPPHAGRRTRRPWMGLPVRSRRGRSATRRPPRSVGLPRRTP